MNLKLIRKQFTEESTIGELYINDVFECFIIEDKDRGLQKMMTPNEIAIKKLHGVTAIPYGIYEVAITFSNRFKTYLPLLMGVTGYEGVRVHKGNRASESEGCLLPGTSKGNNVVNSSKVAFDKLFAKLKAVEKKEKIFIEITK